MAKPAKTNKAATSKKTATKPTKTAKAAKPVKAAKLANTDKGAVTASGLFALLGKTLDDPAVQAVLAKSGSVKVEKPGREGHYAFAKQAGYTLMFRPVIGAPKGTPCTIERITLHSEGQRGFRGFDFPWGITAGTVSDDVRKYLGPSLSGDDNHDLWKLDGVYVEVVYTSGDVADVKVNGDYSTYRVLDLRVRRTELPWEQLERNHRFAR